ncbi:BRO family protein [Bacillus mycoides]|uniref:BRO family protein n=1 Tax=Bacillus mycoides TaxID=1405 RepID=UPI003D19D4E7
MLKQVDSEEKVKHNLGVNNNYTQVGHGGLRENTEFWFLTEEGIYELLMLSRKPIAKQWKKEVNTIHLSILSSLFSVVSITSVLPKKVKKGNIYRCRETVV